MQKLTVLLLAAFLVFGLSACGTKNDEAKSQTPTVYDGTTGTNGTGANGSPSPENNPTGKPLTPSDSITNQADEPSARMGSSYEQMVRNGLVHDSDGILSDNENSVS